MNQYFHIKYEVLPKFEDSDQFNAMLTTYFEYLGIAAKDGGSHGIV